MDQPLFNDGYCKHESFINTPILSDGVVVRIKRSCKDCDKHIKFVPFIGDEFFKMPYGKYSGRLLKDLAIEDSDYCHWLVDNAKRGIAERMERILCNLKKEEN